MSAAEVLEQLRALGRAEVRNTWARYEVAAGPDTMFGVRFGDLEVLAKRHRGDHALACELWATENVDAGERLVRKYGCPGCHDIPGMEKESRIGVELSSFGDKVLEELFFGVADNLEKGGYFFFSSETLSEETLAGRDFMVGPHQRFAHSEGYVRKTLAAAGFAVVEMRDITVRLEDGKPIAGHLVVAQKAH